MISTWNNFGSINLWPNELILDRISNLYEISGCVKFNLGQTRIFLGLTLGELIQSSHTSSWIAPFEFRF